MATKKDDIKSPVLNARAKDHTLDELGTLILAILIKRMGYKRYPTAVPLTYIQKCMDTRGYKEITRRKIEYRIKKMIEEGRLEKWTTKHPTHFKITYYRIPMWNKYGLANILENNQLPSTPDRTHSISATGAKLRTAWENQKKLV